MAFVSNVRVRSDASELMTDGFAATNMGDTPSGLLAESKKRPSYQDDESACSERIFFHPR